MSRRKYDDATKAGTSRIVPFIPGEGSSDRHRRRFEVNNTAADNLAQWANSRGIHFRVLNEGHHWQFKAHGKQADWWPSSAKMVLNQKWDRGVHVHDYLQAERQLRQWGFYEGPK